MLKHHCRVAISVAVVGLACVIAFAGVALAAGSVAPRLRSPQGGKAVTAGHVKLTAYVPKPGNAIKGHVFLTISDKRIIKGGTLRWPTHCGFRCYIATMQRSGNSHTYTYVDPYHFAGNWQDTPGKYYWQVYYYPKGGVVGVLPSRIGSFQVVK